VNYQKQYRTRARKDIGTKNFIALHDAITRAGWAITPFFKD
jgi:hypothetical protein